MNVALVHRRFTTQGGTERFLVGLARYLLDEGHMVHVYCNRVDTPEPRIHFHHLPMLRPAKVLSLWRSAGGVALADHDVVLGLGRHTPHDVYRAGGGAHAAYLEACRPNWRWNPAARLEVRLDRAAVRSAKAVITPSRRAGEDLVEHYGLPPDRLRVIHNGVDTERFQPRAWRREGRPRLVFLGTGFARKGLAEAVEVATRLGATLDVIGTDVRLESWRRNRPGVHFHGAVEAVEELLPQFDAMLLPTRYEPYGNACLEAMACGVPPVTTSVNGASEVFPDGRLVADDIEGLAESVRHVLDSGQTLRDRCRDRALDLPRDRAYKAVMNVLMDARR
ncbi:MAG TPA: glycosyltransferase family 4 protein [Myxococcota bacterium]|nr:glycosyltransferase family 4 protein [Myxococcota bacterium]